MLIQLKNDWDWKNVEGFVYAVTEDFDSSELPAPLGAYYEAYKGKAIFEGKPGTSVSFSAVDALAIKEIVFIGLGTGETFTKQLLRKGIASAFKLLKNKKVTSIGFDLSSLKKVYDNDKRNARIVAESVLLADYAFNDYKSDQKPSTTENVWIKGDFNQEAFEEGLVLGNATVFARKLTNMPANIMTPIKLADLAIEQGLSSGFEVEVKGQSDIEALGMHAFMAVAKGSQEPPQLIVMRYQGNSKSDIHLGLVGKGLTYDSGGLSIKPTGSMLNMKDDMAGASAVIAAMGAIAQSGLKINVTAVVAACENMISGACYKPGDIISSMGGKSIFIGNTDAEGRLTLVDAVTYIQDVEKVTHVVDVATLTGAAVIALGTEATAVLSSDDDFYGALERSFDKADEHVWRMPMLDAYKALLKHDHADLTNAAGAPGMITAGMFIGTFIKDIPWVHMDIAGTAFVEKDDGIYSKGGTGVAVRPLYYLAKKLSK